MLISYAIFLLPVPAVPLYLSLELYLYINFRCYIHYNLKLKTQNTKRQTPNTKRQTPNAKRDTFSYTRQSTTLSSKPSPDGILQTLMIIDADDVSLDIKMQQANDTFELFPRLPIELRNKIWRAACSEQRYLTLKADAVAPYFDLGVPMPSILLVNHESRGEAERCYKKVLLRLSITRRFKTVVIRNPELFRTFYVNNTDIFNFDQITGRGWHWVTDHEQTVAIGKLPGNIARLTGIFPLLYAVKVIQTSYFTYDIDNNQTSYLGRLLGTNRLHDSEMPLQAMPNLKRFILKPSVLEHYSSNHQNACIEDIRSYFQQWNNKYPSIPIPTIEFDSSDASPQLQ